MAGVNTARDGRMTMRIVFANTIENILSRPGTPNGRIPDSTVLAMRMFEATAHPWIREDSKFQEEIRATEKMQGDALTLARWTAVLSALKKAQMLDHAVVPRDNIGGVEEEE